MSELPTHTRVVIVGGGIIGTSIAYHLSRLGWTDIVLLEQHTLTAGSTWHAAGLITSAGFTDETSLWLSNYSRDLYQRLEAETGVSTGFIKTGHLHLATTPHRLQAMRREQAFQRGFGVDSQVWSAAQVKASWPLARVDDVLGAVWNVNDGRANPVDVTMSLARGASQRGVQIFQGVTVTGFTQHRQRVTGVVTCQGGIGAEHVVLAAGMWTRELARLVGVNVPLQAAEHYYLLTEPIDGVHRDLPVIEDPDRYAYFREENGGLLVGLFEPVAAAWQPQRIPTDAAFADLPPDWDRLTPFIAAAMTRIPLLEDVGIKKLFCGPDSFTNNLKPLLGETPELRGLWIAAGLNSLGILLGGGVGSLLAQWLVDGVAPMDVTHFHVDRSLAHESNFRFRIDRTTEQLGALFCDAVFPNWQPHTARGIRRSVLHGHLIEQGACFGESMGWETPLWFAGTKVKPDHPRPEEAFQRSAAFHHSRAEHLAVRNEVAILDVSLMAKFIVQGPDACAVLNYLSVSNVDVAVGRIVYTQWLNATGGIEADLTVTRLDMHRYMVAASDAIERRTHAMIMRTIEILNAHASVHEQTSATTLLSVQGPRSRELLSRISHADFSNAAFPYLSAQQIEVGYASVWALRVTYVGELGWELHIPTEFAACTYELLFAAGADLGIKPCGLNAMNSLRLEKGYRDYGHDIDNADTPLEAGLGFTVAWDKPCDFVGRSSLQTQRDQGLLSQRHVLLKLDDPQPLMFGAEPVYRNQQWVGYVRAAAYGHTVGSAIGIASIKCAEGVDADWLNRGQWCIDIEGQPFSATASLAPWYDPKRLRILDL
jgi:4-methylaminobutanoate oxidase (formaldehyde-forming)